MKERSERFREALKAIRLARGWSQAELAAQLDVSAGRVGNWEAGINSAPIATIKKVAEKLGVTVEFLTGEEPSAMKETAISYNARHVVPAPSNRVPVVSFARAGSVDFAYEDLANQLEDTVEADCKDPNCFGLIVEGDSMEPKVSAGDIVIVAPNDMPRNGDLVVARLEKTEGVLFKLFHLTGNGSQKIKLTSYNPAYPPLVFEPEDFRFIYPVHSRITRWRR